jgi:hypothetical protein
MKLDLIEQVLESPTEARIETLLADEETVFWVDWRQEDDSIPAACEQILRTGVLTGELVKVQSENGYEVYVRFRDRRERVPLTYSGADRHITIYSLNDILRPYYEIRFCIDSQGNDTLAFLPLPSYQWENLEQRFGAGIHHRFHKIAASPNLFIDEPAFETYTEPPTEEEQRAAICDVPYHKYEQAVDLTGCDLISLLDSPKNRVASVVGMLLSKAEMPCVPLPLSELRAMSGEIAEEVHDFANARFGGEDKQVVLHFLGDRFLGFRLGSRESAAPPPPRPWYRRWF